ncbi:hypothetical protein BDW69DRAFT_182518 [Aspergillus filifer]
MWLLLILALGEVTTTVAENCTLDEGSLGDIRTPDGLNEIPQNCPLLNGSLFVNVGYSGPFRVPNITNVTDGVRSIEDTDNDQLGIALFDMPDLEETSHIDFVSMPSLTDWSTPKLKKVEYIGIEISAHISLDSPALESSDEVAITANASSVSLPELVSISGANEYGNSYSH